MKNIELPPNPNERHEKISPTAWGVAYRRTLSDISFSQEIFAELQEIIKKTRTPQEIETLENMRYEEITPMFEARYKLVNRLLEENKTNQILELAAGFSPRGIEMAGDPNMQYIEMDLRGVTNEKREVVQELVAQSKIPNQPNLHLEEGNATDAKDFERAAQLFKNEPINIINEGLLRYLNFEEKAKVAQNVHGILERFGGAWITPDITIKSTDIIGRSNNMKLQNEKVQQLTGINFSENRFETEEDARKFFENLGFDIERHSFMEVNDQLVSPRKLNIPSEDVEKLIGGLVVYVMRVKK